MKLVGIGHRQLLRPMKLVGIGHRQLFRDNIMTVPPPPPDPTSDPPPYRTPQAPPYPASGTSYRTYQLGSAPVQPPVTALPAYDGGTARRTRALAIGVLATALVVLLCGVCGVAGFLLSRGTSGGKQAAAPATQAPASPAKASQAPVAAGPASPGRGAHTVVYELTGNTDTALVTYAVNIGASPEEVDLPWRKQVTVDNHSFLVTVLAVHLRGGPLTCRILVDGREIAKNTSDNAVTCTHLVVD
jgi:hypothetical protein